MSIDPRAGKPATADMRVDIGDLLNKYYQCRPNTDNPAELVAFGTSGHRGSSFTASFTEGHIAAITQAICEYRKAQKINGPLYMGKDTHALSMPAEMTALEVLCANGVTVVLDKKEAYTPTPVISRAILTHNQNRYKNKEHLADGIVITPSHNPPEDGGFKYNPPHGGPAETDITVVIQARANELLRAGNRGVQRMSYERALQSGWAHIEDFIQPYIRDLNNVIDLEIIRSSGLRTAVDPLGGASVGYWQPIAELYNVSIDVVNTKIDPTFSFMTVDHDGKIRMDCSSPYAMAGLLAHCAQYSLAFGNDPDADRHGIVTADGLMNPNHYLCAAIYYLLEHRSAWSANSGVGKTVVSSSLLDRIVAAAQRHLLEVPVGFKWFVPGLFDGSICFGGEESAGASFLRKNGGVWSTDKDGIILNLLAAEITARLGRTPSELYREITAKFGVPLYQRIDAPVTPAQKDALLKLSQQDITATSVAGDKITAIITKAPGNQAAIGGVKVVTDSGWFAARPSGTENIYKIYAESFRDQAHLDRIIADAQTIVGRALTA